MSNFKFRNTSYKEGNMFNDKTYIHLIFFFINSVFKTSNILSKLLNISLVSLKNLSIKNG